jgi:hypothetical protein
MKVLGASPAVPAMGNCFSLPHFRLCRDLMGIRVSMNQKLRVVADP